MSPKNNKISTTKRSRTAEKNQMVLERPKPITAAKTS
jgi:hypothetical protein